MTLKEYRLAKGMTQIEAAKALDLPLSTYNAYETGKRTPPLKVALRIAEAFGVSVEQINFFAGKFHEMRNNEQAATLEPGFRKPKTA